MAELTDLIPFKGMSQELIERLEQVSASQMNKMLKTLYPLIEGKFYDTSFPEKSVHKSSFMSTTVTFKTDSDLITKEIMLECYNQIVKERGY